MAEIEAAVIDEQEARRGFGLIDAFLRKENLIRFIIAFFLSLFQEWNGQTSVGWASPYIP